MPAQGRLGKSCSEGPEGNGTTQIVSLARRAVRSAGWVRGELVADRGDSLLQLPGRGHQLRLQLSCPRRTKPRPAAVVSHFRPRASGWAQNTARPRPNDRSGERKNAIREPPLTRRPVTLSPPRGVGRGEGRPATSPRLAYKLGDCIAVPAEPSLRFSSPFTITNP